MEKECNFRHFEKRDNFEEQKEHWITDGIDLAKISFNGNVRGVYPLTATTIKAHYDETYPFGWQNAGHVDLAANEYGKGRSVYLSGISDCNESYRLIYNILLWVTKKENEKYFVYSENSDVDGYYYENSKTHAFINTTNEKQNTVFYDIDGKKATYCLEPKEIKWIKN